MNFAITLFTVLSMLLFGILAWKQEEKKCLRHLLDGQMYYWSAQIIVSGVLFCFDKYTVLGNAVIVFSIALLCFLEAIRRERVSFTFHINSLERKNFKFSLWDVVMLFFVLLLIFLCRNQNEFYGMSQDEGVYQTQAISFIKGETANIRDFRECKELPEELVGKHLENIFWAKERGMHGFYPLSEEVFPRTVQTREESQVWFTIHGVPTYTALLALWGSIFGIPSMMGVQLCFFALTILTFYEILKHWSMHPALRVAVTVVYAASPIMFWLAQSSLTEMVLAYAMNLFILELCRPGRFIKAWRLAVPVLLFGLIHLSIYTLMPMFVLALTIRFLQNRNSVFLRAGFYMTYGYIACILFVSWWYTEYFYINVSPLYQFPGITEDNALFILLSLGIAYLVWFLALYCTQRYMRSIPQWAAWVVRGTQLILLLAAIMASIGYVQKGGYASRLTGLAYIVLTGVIVLPLLVGFVLVKPASVTRDEREYSILWMYLYVVYVYVAVFRVYIINHYYGDRYLVPFLGIVFLVLAILLSKWKKTMRNTIVTMAILSFSFAYFVYHDVFIVTNKDDSRIEWDILVEMSEYLNENDILILGGDQMISCYFPMRDLSGADVYGYFMVTLPDTIDALASQGREIYILDYVSESTECYEKIQEWEIENTEYAVPYDIPFGDLLVPEVASGKQVWRLSKAK